MRCSRERNNWFEFNVLAINAFEFEINARLDPYNKCFFLRYFNSVSVFIGYCNSVSVFSRVFLFGECFFKGTIFSILSILTSR